MAYETYFNADDLDLDAALLAGFGLKKETEEAEVAEVEEITAISSGDATGHAKVAHAQITHRVGKVGRLQVTFVYHHGEGPHE